GVAAGADLADSALTGVDKSTVEVADGDAKRPLAEVVPPRVGHFESGEVENTEVDRSDGREDSLTFEVRNFQNHLEVPAGAQLFGDYQDRFQHPFTGRHGGVRESQAATRNLSGAVAGTDEAGGHVD